MNDRIRHHEVTQLARLMNDSLDAASFDAGLLKVEDVTPYDGLPDEMKGVLFKAAELVYDRLIYERREGLIRIAPPGRTLPGGLVL